MTANPIASMTSDALAIAEASADELRVTIEHLHGRLAIARAEAESHLERIDAVERDAAVKASQRDTFERALAHESEAGRGLVAQVAELRSLADRIEADRDAHADELRAIRDLVAPGNPQGTVVDAVLVRLDDDRKLKRAAEQLEANAIEERDAAIARAEKAERRESDTIGVADAMIAKLRAEVAELRARPVPPSAIDVDALLASCEANYNGGHHGESLDAFKHGMWTACNALRQLGPVTLPSPDRAEELAATLVGTARASMTNVPIAWSCDFADGNENARRALTNVVRAALAKFSPAPAPSLDAAFLRRTLSATKHGPGGKGGNGPCDAACVKCEAERMLADAPAREAAPTLVAVSDEELRDAYLNDPDDTLSGIRAVRAKLGAAEVTEERLAGAIREAYGHAAPEFVRAAWNHLRATAAKGG